MTDEQKTQMIVFPDEQSAEAESKERTDSVLQNLTPFIVEMADNGAEILIHNTKKEGPLRLSHREALSLAEIIRNLSQSQ